MRNVASSIGLSAGVWLSTTGIGVAVVDNGSVSGLKVAGARVSAKIGDVVGLLRRANRTTSANPAKSKIVTATETRRNDVDCTPENSFICLRIAKNPEQPDLPGCLFGLRFK